ncbi:MAG: PDZ domain-containing protein [Verrucomicrobiota bacterium]
MKTKSSSFITAGLAAVLISPAFALEAPADDAPPPPIAAEKEVRLPEIKLPAAQPKAQVETPFLGVVSSEVPDMLAEHLALKDGEGIIVRSLVPDGPAAKSGIAVNDVITKVGGQPVGSPTDITKQIASHKPGESIRLDLIHRGKPATLDVTLGVKPAEMAGLAPHTLDQLDLEGLPRELAERVRDAIAGNIGGFDLGGDEAQIPPRMEEAMRDLQKRMQGAIGGAGLALPDDNVAGKVQVHNGIFRQMDQQGSVEVKAKDGAKEITVRDQQGKVTWSGPWDTAQDKAAAPADIRQRVDGLNIDHSFKGAAPRLRMGNAAPLDADEP